MNRPDPTDPVAVVQRQLDAYNARDLEAFLATFADDVQAFTVEDAPPMVSDKAMLRERMIAVFVASPNLHATLVHRTSISDFVIDQENITGRMGDPLAMEMVMLYEVRQGLIVKSHIVRQG